MEKIDYEYHVTKAQIRQYQKVPILARLRWIEEMCVLTNMVRAAPESRGPRPRAAKNPRRTPQTATFVTS